MRQLLALFLSLGALVLVAGTPAQASEALAAKRVELAQQDLARVMDLVEAGALPRVRVQQAQTNLDDAQDEVILARTLYGDLPADGANEEASAEMIAAAQRRVDRQQARLEEAQKLVAAGVAAQSYLSPFQEELTSRQTTLDLAQLRARLMADRAEMNRARLAASVAAPLAESLLPDDGSLLLQGMEHYEGDGSFDEFRQLQPLELAFASKFAHPLPISAEGETEVHRALGFDHRGRVDVAVNPGAPEGVWLRQYLQSRKIPYYAFARAIRGKATAPHIHIGPGSTRLSTWLGARPHAAD